MDGENLLEHAVESFGSAPNQDLAEQIAQQAERHPAILKAEINRIANGYHDGTIRSPWGVLKKKLAEMSTLEPRVKANNSREKALMRAEQWMRTAGMHFDRWPEIQDELFGDRGQLRQHPDLEPKIHELYDQLRPTGEQLEREAEQRALDHRTRNQPKPKALKEAA